MKTLHDIAVYWSLIEKKWVIKHTCIKKPFTTTTTVTKQKMFLSKTALKTVRDRINEALSE